MFEVQELNIRGAFLLRGRSFNDERGSFLKTIHRESFERYGLNWNFTEHFHTVSHKNVIRGIHFQIPPHDQDKLVYCVQGQILDVVVDLRLKSPTYGRVESIELDASSAESVYLPSGVGHGFRALKDRSIVLYAVTKSHVPEADAGILWKSLPFDWGITDPIVSARDKRLPPLETFQSPFVWENL
jgi:dTDP-4-dehydrorhamnose 3,5-epimerase